MSASEYTPVEQVRQNGNELMVKLLEAVFGANSSVKQTIISYGQRWVSPFAFYPDDKHLFNYCFPHPGRIERSGWRFSSEELVAIAAVYLFIAQAHYFEESVTMVMLHDAIRADFSEHLEDSTKFGSRFFSLTKNKEKISPILRMDIIRYYDLYETAAKNNHPATC